MSLARRVRYTDAARVGPLRAEVFKDIIWLLSQSHEHTFMFLADLEWAVMPPFLIDQFRVFYKDKTPVACVCWATVSDEVLARLKKLGARIRPREWNSGEHVVLMGVVAPFGGAEQVVEEVKAKIFAGKVVHMLQEVVVEGAGE